MISSSAEILFQLLRAALGNEAAGTRLEGLDLGSVSGEVWKKVIDLSFDQGVAAIAVDGLGFAHDGSTSSPTGIVEGNPLLESDDLEDLRYELFGEALACEEDYRKHLEVIRNLTELWQADGLDTFALKGVAFARYYPVPEHRHSGDFDCYVRYSDGRAEDDVPAWRLADNLAEAKGISVDDSMNKHSRYVAEGVSVENHRNVIGVNGSRSLKEFDAYLRGLLESGERLKEDLPLMVPCWLFDALFCVAHAQTHFIEEEGITLKHVLDWVVIRKACGAKELYERFLADIDRFGLRKFFDAFDGVAGEVRGFAHDNDTLRYDDDNDNQERLVVRRMLEDILAPKAVRHYESRFLAHLNILRQLWANRWKFRLYSDTSFIATVWRYVYGHFFDRDNV